MKRMTRRTFIISTGSVAAGAALGLSPHARVLGANDDIRMGVVGFRSQGRKHIEWFHGLPGVRVVALCDVDRDELDRVDPHERRAQGLRDQEELGARDPRIQVELSRNARVEDRGRVGPGVRQEQARAGGGRVLLPVAVPRPSGLLRR